MRPIKFRAWDFNHKKMHWPCEIPVNDNAGNPIVRTFELGGIETCPPNPDELEDYVLMQFTGLKDRNGKEIYEGDLVIELLNVRSPRPIEWKTAGFSIKLGEATWLSMDPRMELEIVGNIYENPELLNP